MVISPLVFDFCIQKMLATNYSFGIERDEAQLEKNDRDHTKWTNPLETRFVEKSCLFV